jgi:hypothetical protein
MRSNGGGELLRDLEKIKRMYSGRVSLTACPMNQARRICSVGVFGGDRGRWRDGLASLGGSNLSSTWYAN